MSNSFPENNKRDKDMKMVLNEFLFHLIRLEFENGRVSTLGWVSCGNLSWHNEIQKLVHDIHSAKPSQMNP